MLDFETITVDSPPTSNVKKVFLQPAFRLALAKEFRLEAINVKFTIDTTELCIPAYRKKGMRGQQLIIGAGFDSTGYFDCPDGLTFQKVINYLCTNLQASPVQQLEIRTQHSLDCVNDQSDKYELRIHLNTPCSERFKSFSKSTRRNIRQPFNRGFYFEIDNSFSHLEAFYKLYLGNMHELGSLPHSWQFIHEVWQNCREDIAIFVGYMDQQPVVSSLLFLSQNEAYGVWSGTHSAYKKNNVFLVMLWSILEYCEQTGRRCYNLGRSSANTGAFHFKERLATDKSKIYYYQIDTSAATTSHSPVKQAASWIIRNTPPVVMNTLSHHLLHRFY